METGSDQNINLDSNRQQILSFIEQHKGELCIDPCGDLVRLVEFREDGEDYYYRCQTMNLAWQKDGYVNHSGVGWIIPLKPRLLPEEYAHLDLLFELNWRGNPQAL